jgi:hypothetical protein
VKISTSIKLSVRHVVLLVDEFKPSARFLITTAHAQIIHSENKNELIFTVQ